MALAKERERGGGAEEGIGQGQLGGHSLHCAGAKSEEFARELSGSLMYQVVRCVLSRQKALTMKHLAANNQGLSFKWLNSGV